MLLCLPPADLYPLTACLQPPLATNQTCSSVHAEMTLAKLMTVAISQQPEDVLQQLPCHQRKCLVSKDWEI